MSSKQAWKEVEHGNMELASMALCVFPSSLFQMYGQYGQQISPTYKREIDEVLVKYNAVLEVPTEQPQHKSHDYSIPLVPNAPTVNVRPYRHPSGQKDAIEAMVKELLEGGVIRPSHCPFFFPPIMMVKKKDLSWRMCVDFRQLNKYTVKDKFPIPVIKELIDELSGAMMFSKLDLRSSYHQIRMNPQDIYKTAFRTHQGRYEFLVMLLALLMLLHFNH